MVFPIPSLKEPPVMVMGWFEGTWEELLCVSSGAPALGLGNTLGPGLVGSVGGINRSLKEVPRL